MCFGMMRNHVLIVLPKMQNSTELKYFDGQSVLSWTHTKIRSSGFNALMSDFTLISFIVLIFHHSDVKSRTTLEKRF